ncbi:MAG: hypothetical protein TU36_000565 [Vulcanisaeta sp. AZ3]
MVSTRALREMSRLFTAVLYLIVSAMALVWDFPFYPLPVAVLIVIVATALAYSGRTKLAFAVMVVILIPALLYVYRYAALGALLLILILLVLIEAFDWLGVGVGMLAWELSIVPNAFYVLSIPVILTSPSLTVGVTRRVMPLKSLITFLVLYIPTLILLNADASVMPWFGHVTGQVQPLSTLTAASVGNALSGLSLGFSGLGQAAVRVLLLGLVLMCCRCLWRLRLMALMWFRVG